MKRLGKRLLLSGLAACFVFPTAVIGQAFPTKALKVVVPYPPGGVDVTIRMLIPTMEKELGQPVIIDYKPGASGVIGTDYVARADPDGYVLLATSSNPWVVSPAMRKTSPYDPIKDFTPLSIVLEGVNLIVAGVKFPPNNVTELIAYAKKNPRDVAWATSGTGSSWHLDEENFNRLAGTTILHTPFKGFGPMIPALLNGQVQVGGITYQIINKLVAAGKVKMIGVLNTNQKAKHLFPSGVQTVSSVLPEFVTGPSWVGMGGPAGLPAPIVTRLNKAIVNAIQSPLLQERCAKDRCIVTGSTPQEFAERIKSDFESAVRIVREARIAKVD